MIPLLLGDHHQAKSLTNSLLFALVKHLMGNLSLFGKEGGLAAVVCNIVLYTLRLILMTIS